MPHAPHPNSRTLSTVYTRQSALDGSSSSSSSSIQSQPAVEMVAAQQNTELQRVWRMVQELAAQVSANQQETERLRRHIDLTQLSVISDPQKESNTAPAPAARTAPTTAASGIDTATHSSLKQAYVAVTDENVLLRGEIHDLSKLCAEYEYGLTRAMSQIRNHEHQVTQNTIDLHRNYQSRINAQEEETQVLRDELSDARFQLVQLNGLVRTALENHSDVQAETVIETLMHENEALRLRVAGLEQRVEREQSVGDV